MNFGSDMDVTIVIDMSGDMSGEIPNIKILSYTQLQESTNIIKYYLINTEPSWKYDY